MVVQRPVLLPARAVDPHGAKVAALLNARPPLPPGLANPYLRLFRLVHGHWPTLAQRWGATVRPSDLNARLDLGHDARARYAFAVPDEAALARIVNLGPLVEIGAGSGYWAALLRRRGLDVLAFDKYRSSANPLYRGLAWTEVRLGDSKAAAQYRERNLFLCWPPYDAPMAADSLRAYRGQRLIYIGESRGGETANAAFFNTLEREWRQVSTQAIPNWHSQHDELTVWLRHSQVG